MTKKILITGASGFVGKNLKQTLSCKYNVIAASRQDLNLLDRERVCEYIKSEKFDIVIHTATYDAAPSFSKNNPDKVLEYNLRMFDNLSQCDKDYKALLYFGSGAEWKREKPYGLSKYFMDQVTRNKDNIYNLRLYSVYGEGTDWRYRFINNACAKVSLGMPINIPKINKCDYLHIKDLCNVVEYYINNYKILPKSSDICSGNVLSPEEIVKIIKNIAPVSGVKYRNSVTPTVSRSNSSQEAYYGDSNFVSSLPITLTGISDGIESLIKFYSNNIVDYEEFVY
jgi:nucleoside-diphosphate-sugar epimerase